MKKLELILTFFLLSAILGSFTTGCTGAGDLRFNPTASVKTYDLAGKIDLSEIIETDLLGSTRGNLQSINDFSKFTVTANNVTARVNQDGSFSINDIEYSSKMLIKAESGKITLLLRVYPEQLDYTDISNLSISVLSTAKALVWQYASLSGKELTDADISAREYSDELASLTTAVKLALQLSPDSVDTNILEVPMVKDAAMSLANKIEPKEQILRDANQVFANIFIRKDIDMLKTYISPSFSNDWNSSADWNNVIEAFTQYFKQYDFTKVDWNIQQMELLPDNTARIRIDAKATLKDTITETETTTQEYVFDSIWRKEGSFWKIYRNLPYKKTDPTQIGADTRWGEIADIHKQLQTALASENIETFKKYISPNFGNDFDVTSTYNDIIQTAQTRFAETDVKIASYSIVSITFTNNNLATVHCYGEVKVINLIPGIDIDSGKIEANVIWRKEDNIWKIYRNLPYKFKHILN